MHDLDRTLGHTRMEAESLFEFEEENESNGEPSEADAFPFRSEQDEVFDEAEVNEIAAELLSVSNQQELNDFLGSLIKKAGGAIGKIVKSTIGQHLGSYLKSAAGKALPIAGRVLGNAIAPGVGGKIGGKIGSMAGSMFGLELEGLSAEDVQFEAAKQFVRFGGEATQRALKLAEQGIPVPSATSTAITQAAERYLPGLTRKRASSQEPRLPQRGSWERQGSKIVLNLARA
jgi:uncharacterized protein (DUF697 family)